MTWRINAAMSVAVTSSSRSWPNFIASFAVGLGPVFWLMISEIFPCRCAARRWPSARVPETKDRSLEQIEREIGGEGLRREAA